MNKFAMIESVLFAFGDEGADLKQLMVSLNIHDDDEMKAILDAYAKSLNNAERGVELHIFGENYKLITKKELHDVISRSLQFNKTRNLSQAALETLAIIAYKQPVTRLEIEEVRGVNSDMMCRKLEAMDLIRECGRADAIGRPILYEVTDSFMDVFNLTSLKELPEIKLEVMDENDELFK